jgi:hypothetical protein
MKYTDSDLPDRLTTEQVIEVASNMSDGEDLAVQTPITQFLWLHVSMGNKPLEGVSAGLIIEGIEGMHGFMQVEASYGGIVSDEQEESGVGTFVSQDIRLNIQDVVKLFRLDSTARWKITDHGTII